MTWHGILSSSPAVFYYKMKKAVSLKSSLYRIFLRGRQTSIISTRKSIIPDHFPQSHKVTLLKQAVWRWLCHLNAIRTSPQRRTAHRFQGNYIYESQTAITFPLGTTDTQNNATNTQAGRLMIIVCLRFSKMGRFGYWEETSPNDLTNDEGGRKNGSKQTFPTGKQYACVCLVIVLLVLNYSQQSSKVRAFQLYLWLKIDVCKLENIFGSMCVRKSRSLWVIRSLTYLKWYDKRLNYEVLNLRLGNKNRDMA